MSTKEHAFGTGRDGGLEVRSAREHRLLGVWLGVLLSMGVLLVLGHLAP